MTKKTKLIYKIKSHSKRFYKSPDRLPELTFSKPTSVCNFSAETIDIHPPKTAALVHLIGIQFLACHIWTTFVVADSCAH